MKNYSVAVKERRGALYSCAKLFSGADKSYGIQVAKLAGLPEGFYREQRNSLELEQTGITPDLQLIKEKEKPMQISFFVPDPPKNPIIAELESLNLNNLTPLDALLKLNQWQNKLKNNGL